MKFRKYILFILLSLLSFLCVAKASTKAPVDVTQMSISDIQDAFDKGYLNSELLVNLYLERINEYDSLFNSINQINPNAVEQARELDQERANGNIRGKLHGIPILVKNNIDVVGLATTGGTKALSDNYPNQNAYAVQKLIDEGAIILGATNMSEMAFAASNSYSSYGYVKNVFNTKYSSYGSSGGSAVSVAAVFAAASLGTDTNSSVRLPAAAAGLVGLRPTIGNVSKSGVIPYDPTRDTVGILTRNVVDNALIMDVISGKDVNDSTTLNAVAYDVNEFDDDYSGEKIRIGIITNFFDGVSKASVPANGITDSDIKKLSDAALEKFKTSNVELVYIDQFLTTKYYSIANSTMSGILMCDAFNEYIKGTTGHIRSFQALVKDGRYVQSLDSYIGGCGGEFLSKETGKNEKRQSYRDYVDDFFEKNNIDAIAYPVLKNKVLEYNKSGMVSPSISIGSVIGYPSITLPMGVIGDFSYGIEFMSKANQEGLLFNLSAMFEKANGNEFRLSTLTPSLYEIPDSVEQLKVLYETKNFDGEDNQQLLNDIKEYFVNYSTNENAEVDATNLLKRYKNQEANSEDKKTKKLSTKKIFTGIWKIILLILKVIGVLFGLFVVYFIYRLWRYYRRKKRRRKAQQKKKPVRKRRKLKRKRRRKKK